MVMRTLTALYDDYEKAAAAVDRLEAAGIPHSEISIVAQNDGKGAASAGGGDTKGVSPDAGAGASLGTVLGGGAGLLAGLGVMAIPGIGPVVAAGWLVAAFTGAGVGAATGGLLAALTGAGLIQADAETYAEGVRRGGTLVTVRAEEARADRVTAILDESGAIDLDERAQGWRAEGWTGGTASRSATDEVGSTAIGAAGSTTTGLDTESGRTLLTPDEDRPAGASPRTTPGGVR